MEVFSGVFACFVSKGQILRIISSLAGLLVITLHLVIILIKPLCLFCESVIIGKQWKHFYLYFPLPCLACVSLSMINFTHDTKDIVTNVYGYNSDHFPSGTVEPECTKLPSLEVTSLMRFGSSTSTEP